MRFPVNDDDARDLAKAVAGDHDAFARIYDRHAAVVMSLCRARSASHGDLASAEDACQETFIRAFKLLPRVNGQVSGAGGLRSWLYAIARRVCSEARRSFGRRRAHEGQAMMFTVAEQRTHAVSAASHEGGAGRVSADQLDRLSHALAQLDDRERLAIHLHYLEINPEQAAREAIGLSRSGYYKALTRAKGKLAAMLADQTANVS